MSHDSALRSGYVGDLNLGCKIIPRDIIRNAAAVLDENNVPSHGRYIRVPQWFVAAYRRAMKRRISRRTWKRLVRDYRRDHGVPMAEARQAVPR